MAFPTSDLYKEAIDKLVKTTYIDGELSNSKGDIITIDNDTIDQGSFYITNQCVSSDAFSYGSVFSAEAGITLKTEIDRYSLYGATIQIYYNILLSNNEYERIPLGKFYVNEPNRVGRNITIKAYDEMVNLDEDISESTTGKPFDLLVMLSEKFGFELAQTQEEIEALVNGGLLLSVVGGQVKTYRDLLSYIASVTCTFAVFDRYGKLKLCTFSKEVTKEIDSKLRASSTFSDFETFFSVAKAKFITSSSYKEYVAYSTNNGLIYDFAEVPIVQGLDEANQEVLDNIFAELNQVNYTPCDITFSGDPSIDLGDMIRCYDRDGNEVISLVTFYKWTYRGRHQIKSAGSNPKVAAAKDKSNDTSNLEVAIESKTVAVYPFTNASDYTIKGGTDTSTMKDIIRITFAVNEDTTALFMATINFELDTDGIVEFEIYIDGVFYEENRFTQYCKQGANCITISTYITCEQDTAYRFVVYCKTKSVESKIKRLSANDETFNNAHQAVILAYENIVKVLKESEALPIETLEDTITYDVVDAVDIVPTMTVGQFNIKASIFGQGIAGKVAWDGTIMITEQAYMYNVGEDVEVSMLSREFLETYSTETQIPVPASIVEMFSLLETNNEVSMLSVIDEASVGTIVVNYIFNTAKALYYLFDESYVSFSSGSFKLNTEHSFGLVQQEIDSGHMYSMEIKTSDKESIESVVIEQ